jgi:transposase
MQLGDARKLTQDAQEALRRRAVKLVVVNRKPVRDVAEVIGVARWTVYKWVFAYRERGEQAIAKKRRGQQHGERAALSSIQCKIIQRFITDRCPDQLKMPFALWTREAVQHLIHHCFGIKLHISTVGNYLRAWGYTTQKPLHRSYAQQPQRIERWLKEEYPAIASRAKAENAEIHWGDESGVCSSCQVGTSYAPKGKTPVLKHGGKRLSVSLISTITNKGSLRFMVYDGGLNIPIFLKFLRRLIQNQERKIFLILDNLKVHHGKKVQSWVTKHRDAIELFFLPPYAPEYNPDEYLNNAVKKRTHKEKMSRNQQELSGHVRSTLAKLQKEPETVKNLFKAPKVLYAA